MKRDSCAGCEPCRHRRVVVAPGTQRQVIARYKAAWDACYACARAAMGERDAAVDDIYGMAEASTEIDWAWVAWYIARIARRKAAR